MIIGFLLRFHKELMLKLQEFVGFAYKIKHNTPARQHSPNKARCGGVRKKGYNYMTHAVVRHQPEKRKEYEVLF